MRERAAMEGRTDGKRAVGRLSGSCGSCQRLNSDKEKKKIQRVSPSPLLFLGEELDGGEGERRPEFQRVDQLNENNPL